jgi:hypothetical protein
MKRRKFIGLSAAGIAGTASAVPSVFHAGIPDENSQESITERELNPNTKWLRDAKWGFFTHYLPHNPSDKIPDHMTGDLWTKKVNSFNVQRLGRQLSELNTPYFFITIGQKRGWYCSPNKAFEELFAKDVGRLTERDLVQELAEELVPRGIRMCVYLPNFGRHATPEEQLMYQQVIREWSDRWGKSISAWWIDGGVFDGPDRHKEYTAAYRSGNPDALVSYNTGPIGMTRDLKKPATEYEDYTAGETNWHLPVSGFRPWDKKEYYLGPNISGDQLHFLTFMGDFWGMGKEPRFNDELAIGWNKHTAKYGGTISWDVPLTDSGLITDPYMRQLALLSKSLNNY